MKSIGIIGFGAIGQSIAKRLASPPHEAFRLVAVCMREGQLESMRPTLHPTVRVTANIDDMLAAGPDIVIEAAGHDAVLAYGKKILQQGRELCVLSTGALAEDRLRESLVAAAAARGARIIIPSGALAGFDGLLSLRESGDLQSVSYRSTKPPYAWKSTPAENGCDLDALSEPRVVFRGSAREAARLFPKNANLAAAVAIAGVGFDRTAVELVADPSATGNAGRLVASSPTARFELTLENVGMASNPKSSEITAISIVAALRNRAGVIRFLM